jgi:spermidine synthase
MINLAAIFLFSFSSTLTLCLLIKEMLPLFFGLEFVLGIILFFYFLGTGLGGYFVIRYGKKFLGSNTLLGVMAALSAVFSLSTAFFARYIFALDINTVVPVKTIFLCVMLSALPVSFFVCASAVNLILSQTRFNKNFSIAALSLGAALGGAGYGFFMVELSDPLSIAVALGGFFICASLSARSLKQRIIFLCFTFLGVFLLAYNDENASKVLNAARFGGEKVVEEKYSAYGQNVLLEKNGEYSLFSNGVKVFSLPYTNIIEAEDFAHIPMLFAERPENVLIIGSAAKYLPMILRHKARNITYVETDSAIISIIKHNIAKLGSALSAPNLKIENAEGRSFVKNTPYVFDVVFIGAGSPVNLDLNRYYTEEFFALLAPKVAQKGFAALKLPGIAAYDNTAMAELNISVINSARGHFPYFQVLPGDENIIIFSKSKMPFRLHVKKRLRALESAPIVLNVPYIDEKMDTSKVRWVMKDFKNNTRDSKRLFNADFKPNSVILSFLYVQSLKSPYLTKMFRLLIEYSYVFVFIAVILFFIMKSRYIVTSFAAGATAVWMQLILIFSLQVYMMSLYQMFGFMCAMLALGFSAGYIYDKKTAIKHRINKRFFLSSLLTLLWAMLWAVIYYNGHLYYYMYLAFPFISGFILALEYSQITLVCSAPAESSRVNAAMFFGAAFAAALGGAYLIPVWGFTKALLFVVLARFFVFAWWADTHRRGL